MCWNAKVLWPPEGLKRLKSKSELPEPSKRGIASIGCICPRVESLLCPVPVREKERDARDEEHCWNAKVLWYRYQPERLKRLKKGETAKGALVKGSKRDSARDLSDTRRRIGRMGL